ncbi:MAG: fatty acid desaturase, partial [Pseudomonadota bacterium]|nr:fatty acid desaturase [Pseudomonadota bacterium]
MLSQVGRASGHGLILVPPALLVASVALAMPALALVGLIVVAPFLRILFGDAPEGEPEWTEGFATVLEGLPVACAAACLGATVYVVWALRRRSLGAGDLAWLGGSLWAVFMFASCAGHELLHRRSELSRAMGRILSGVIGYPLLEHEHRAHHVKGGNVEAAECPRLDESVWAFTARRSVRVFGTAWEGDVVAASRRGNRLAGGLPVSIAATLVTAAAFGMAAGVKGLVLYALVALAVAWTMQVMAYVQHWG